MTKTIQKQCTHIYIYTCIYSEHLNFHCAAHWMNDWFTIFSWNFLLHYYNLIKCSLWKSKYPDKSIEEHKQISHWVCLYPSWAWTLYILDLYNETPLPELGLNPIHSWFVQWNLSIKTKSWINRNPS